MLEVVLVWENWQSVWKRN